MMFLLGLLWISCVVGHGAMVGTPELPGHACDCWFVCIIKEPWWALAKGALSMHLGAYQAAQLLVLLGW